MISKLESVERMLRGYSALSSECEQLERVIKSLNKERTRAMHSKVYTDERKKKIAEAASAAALTLSELQLGKIAQQLEIENHINKLQPELAYVIRGKYILRMHARDIAREMSVQYIKTYSERQIYRFIESAKAQMADNLKKLKSS